MTRNEEVTIWQQVMIFLDDNQKKHFTDNISGLIKRYEIKERMCKCKNILDNADCNGNCKKCGLKEKILLNGAKER